MTAPDTIFALSSGRPPAGVAVIRVSGPLAGDALDALAGGRPPARRASLRAITDPATGEVLDRAIVLWLPGPGSFTGEDSAELMVHGGPAVVSCVIQALACRPGLRAAEAGEFSRRAFENGRLDLTEVEALADLVAAETRQAQRQALANAGGAFRDLLEGWRGEIVRMMALVEAELDFADEDDVPGDAASTAWPAADSLAKRIRARLAEDVERGEIARDGFEVVLLGRPNAGKSSLLNALARREAAIVSEEAGTTRDVIEVAIDLDGWRVIVADTAGLREAEGAVEREGIRRARERAGKAHLVIWLQAPGDGAEPDQSFGAETLLFHSKDDAGAHGASGVSVRRVDGLDPLLAAIRERLVRFAGEEPAVVTRERHRRLLTDCADCLDSAASRSDLGPELRAEFFREAAQAIARLTGKVDVEDLLDVIFREFCIGK